jgi:hypothetical protein
VRARLTRGGNRFFPAADYFESLSPLKIANASAPDAIYFHCAPRVGRVPFVFGAHKTIERAPINSGRAPDATSGAPLSHQLTNQAELAAREAPRLPPPPLDPNIEFHCNNSLTWQKNGLVCV